MLTNIFSPSDTGYSFRGVVSALTSANLKQNPASLEQKQSKSSKVSFSKKHKMTGTIEGNLKR